MSDEHAVACEWCGAHIVAADLDDFCDAFLAHVRAVHGDFPYPDVAVRDYAAATQRISDATERLDTIGAVTVERVDEDRIDDWLAFFDRDAFAGNPAWASCYCAEPHLRDPQVPLDQQEARPGREKRALMVDLLRAGQSFGYLAYVDGHPAAWVNASRRSAYALYRRGDGADPPDEDVVAISCFIVAPPYRKHGLARQLLERVLADAAGRGATWVEAYPLTAEREDDAGNFRGPRSLYDAHGFETVEERASDTVLRRPT
jgi:GNAT superfamily N-acetyltransferase